jgi:hypothetical protein
MRKPYKMHVSNPYESPAVWDVRVCTQYYFLQGLINETWDYQETLYVSLGSENLEDRL